jgi:quercetin dioxygenase-like cupin family protein
MTRVRTTLVFLFVAALGVAATAQTAQKEKAAATAPAKHAVVTSGDLKWGPAPPSLPAGAEAAVVDGDPTKPGPFVMRAKFPAGYLVPPHWHPTDENLTILSGSFAVGTGDKADEASMKTLGPGDFVHMPKQMHHYAMAKEATTIQIHGMGPFAITYVNPSDDPRKKTATESK